MAERKPTPEETAAFLAELQKQSQSSAGNPQFGSLGALTPVASLMIPQAAQAAIDIGRTGGDIIYEHPGQTALETLKLLALNPTIQARIANKATDLFLGGRGPKFTTIKDWTAATLNKYPWAKDLEPDFLRELVLQEKKKSPFYALPEK